MYILVANRVLSVGDPKRAELLAKLLDTDEKMMFKRASNRGYVVYTGKKNGVRTIHSATDFQRFY